MHREPSNGGVAEIAVAGDDRHGDAPAHAREHLRGGAFLPAPAMHRVRDEGERKVGDHATLSRSAAMTFAA